MSKSYNCSVIRMSPGVLVPELRFGGNGIDSYFAHASGQRIRIKFTLPDGAAAFQDQAEVTADDLHFALAKTLQNTAGPVNNIGLIFAAEFSGHPELLGLMFDLGFAGPSAAFDAVPREGCAVFVNAVQQLRPNNLFHEELTYTATHELGHVFNLGHMHDPRGFMLPSQFDGSHLDLRDFADSQKKLLELADHAVEIEPGGNAYGRIGTLTGGGDYTVMTNVAEGASPFGLEMHIDVAQREFWRFEPIELDVEIRAASGVRRTFSIPNAVDPGFESFGIFIEDPDGERRRYRSPTRLCSAVSLLTIAPSSPFRRDIPIFGQGAAVQCPRGECLTAYGRRAICDFAGIADEARST